MELLVVIGIIAMLISMLLPALNKARESAVTVSCLAKMREMNNAARLYATENRGYFPPIVEAAIANATGAYAGYPSWAGGPCIFPINTSSPAATGSSGYLSKYMGVSNIQTKYVCPALVDGIANVTTGNHSYRYNRYLGGMPDNWHVLPNVTYPWSDRWRFARPWQISAVRQSSNFAVFIEADSVANFYGSAANSLWFRQNADAEQNGSAPYGGPYASPNAFHSSSGAVGPHNRRRSSNIPGTPWPIILSTMNVAYADGSARSVLIKFDRFPIRIPEIWVRPERQSATW